MPTTTVTMGEQRVQGGPSELLQMMNSADVGAKHMLHVKALNAKSKVSPKLQVPIPEVTTHAHNKKIKITKYANVIEKACIHECVRFPSLPDL